MALNDIPTFVRAQAGDLIRSDDWNKLQQLMRSSLRMHQHTRVAALPVDSAASDEAQQIDSAEIANGAITAAKMAADSVTNAAIADAAVGSAQLIDGAVTNSKIGNNAITAQKLSFQTIKSGSATIGANGTIEQDVQLAAPSTKTTIYFPTIVITDATGPGSADVSAVIVYKQAGTGTGTDVFIRLTNFSPNTSVTLVWNVLTFTNQ